MSSGDVARWRSDFPCPNVHHWHQLRYGTWLKLRRSISACDGNIGDANVFGVGIGIGVLLNRTAASVAIFFNSFPVMDPSPGSLLELLLLLPAMAADPSPVLSSVLATGRRLRLVLLRAVGEACIVDDVRREELDTLLAGPA